jgi:hypothetical protein
MMQRILRSALVLLLFLLIVSAGAWASDPDFSADHTITLLSKAPPLGSSWELRTDQYRLPSRRHHRDYSDTGDSVCYTMRSYLMERGDRNSDVTRQVGYTTCQPAIQYNLRFSGEKLEVPAQ